MSAGAVIKYAMTLDGQQFISELRAAKEQAKQSETEIKRSGSAMADVGKASAAASVHVVDFGDTMGNAARATGSFNAMQSAFTQAIGGNFVGAINSGTRAVRGLQAAAAGANAAMTLGVAAVAAIVGAAITYFSRMRQEAEETKAALAEFARWKDDYDKKTAQKETGDPFKNKLAGADDAGLQKMLADYQRAYELAKKKAEIEIETRKKMTESGNADRWQENYSGGFEDAIAKQNEYADQLNAIKDRIKETASEKAKIAADEVSTEEEKAAKLLEIASRSRQELDKLQQEFEQKKTEDSIADPIAKLEYRKKMLEAKAEGHGGTLSGMTQEEADVERQKYADQIYETEKEIAALKKSAAEQTEAEGKQRLADAAKLALAEATVAKEKAQGRVDAAKAEIMNPGEARRAEREAEREKRREELREKARMTGNSEEAKARRAELALAKEGLKDANKKLEDAANNPNLPEDPAVEQLKLVVSGISGLKTVLS